MAKAKIVCARCGRLRYEDRLQPGRSQTVYAGRLVCGARSTCHHYRKRHRHLLPPGTKFFNQRTEQ